MPHDTRTWLDRVLPDPHFRSRYTRRIDADPRTVWDAMMDLTAGDLPVSRTLMRLRSAGRTRLDGPLIKTFPTPTLITDEGTELVKGKIAKFWRVRPELAPVEPGDPGAFTAFARPGWAKVALSLRVDPDGDGSVLSFETRVRGTDAFARRVFAPYWALIRLGGAGFIRLEILGSIARRAERTPRTRV
ncbi:DUF2867 domain-containing protein [Actinomadura rubrisoli]|uniref:DUF2867 domain-containing protein n=1 Tax=Actinomadura rubrisoli TaxID=2530368 RepID=A0A4R5BFR2_9ACTN|nr:DUF2867 domain-containing protein [Actinomadura rubrisoli]TDD83726.1 DUF2867 domain-containing protein [Actinomadura rubrisoli]